MQAPRASAAWRMAGATITQAARDAASCCSYLGLLRKLSWDGVAASSEASPSMACSRSPQSSPPSASTIEPSRSCTPGRLRRAAQPSLGGVKRLDHLVGDVVLWVDIDGFLQHDVVLLGFRNLLDDPV